MCSILGFVNFEKKIFDKNLFINASNIMIHRGPDNNQYLSDNNIYQFAFNRLSILDISSNGNQPMESHCGRYVCMFNGEIYNYKKIYHEIRDFFLWNGNSDTEVLLNSWIYWGLKCLEKIDGMFAFSIWDKKLKKIIVARDRIGEKPLYYYKNKNSILFSSRPSPIIYLMPSLKKKYDENSLSFFLDSGYFPRNKSVYKDIAKLEPGNYIEFTENNFIIRKYWSIHDFDTILNKKKTLDNYVDECEVLLKNSIEERLSSDKPLGFFLSGGIDSSLIVALASKVLNKKKIKAFNLGFENKDFDESKEANFVAETLGISLDKCMLTPQSLIELLPDIYDKFDEPFFDSSCFPLMAISKYAKKKVDVVLTGDGGDELFGGYEYYRIIKVLSKLNINFKILKKILILIIQTNLFPHKINLIMHALSLSKPVEMFAFVRSIKKDFDSVMDQSHKNKLPIQEYFLNECKQMNVNLGTISKIMRLDLLYTLNDDYLQKTDLSTMAYSLECRSPFLSKNLVEWTLTIPEKFKVSYVEKKIILKKLAEKYFPKKFIYKKKKGFEMPIKYWLKNELFDWSKSIIYDEKNYLHLPIDQKKVIKIFNLHKSGKRDCHPYLWAILMLLKFNKKIG